MRITVDATSALLRSAGVKSYTYHWIRSLRKAARGDEIRAFPYLGDFASLDHEASMLGPLQTLSRIALLHFANIPGNPAIDWICAGSGIFHASNQVHNAPRRARLTATVHDLTCWMMPQFHTEGNVRADRNFAEKIWKRAAGLIAVSENTRQDAIRLLGIAPEKIRTIYSGVPEEYFCVRKPEQGRQYVLYVGTIEPRKNLETLLDAWRLLKPDLLRQYELIIAGPSGWRAESTLARIRSEATYLGYVPEAELPSLVAGAAVFAYPSLYEGFGFPVVQAMAAGVPVLTSNTSCLPEVTAGAAALVDPKSVAEIAAALTRLLESEAARADLVVRGRERAKKFTWSACAEESLAFFRSVAGR
ncbi:MAG: glycosyltransferase family 4 protein [Acidobacteriia bacterium]|nr:glycosyltransferase family 4 protein [Terriglobia bacterium]